MVFFSIVGIILLIAALVAFSTLHIELAIILLVVAFVCYLVGCLIGRVNPNLKALFTKESKSVNQMTTMDWIEVEHKRKIAKRYIHGDKKNKK